MTVDEYRKVMDTEHEVIPAKIKAVQDAINHEIIGLSKMKKLQIKLSNSTGAKNNSYTFELEIPFAGMYLKWEVIFSNESMCFAPDFEFVNDQFLTDPDEDVIVKHIPALHHWNINDPKCMYDVIKQILQLYKKYQVDRLQVNKYEHQYTEYLMLIKELGIPEEDIEVHIDEFDYVHFLFQLPIDVSMLPPYMGKYFEAKSNTNSAEIENPGSNTIIIRASYSNQKLQTEVWLNPHFEEVIGNAPQMRVSFNRKDLREYVAEVKAILQQRLSLISMHYKKRNQFVSTMLAYQGKSIIEYDNVTFSKMTLLLEAQDNHCLVMIQLGKNFEKPMVQLRSLHTERNSKPMVELLNYSYNASATIEETVKKILNTIYIFLTTYKGESNHNSKNDFKCNDGVGHGRKPA